MKNFQFSIFNFQLLAVILAFLVLFSVFAVADEFVPDEFTYLFYLYYDKGQLFTDRDFEYKYDIIAGEFTPEAVSINSSYRGEVISFRGQILSTFLFDPQKGDTNFSEGKISVKAPYFPNGERVVFYNFQGNLLLTISVSESSFCNEDGICDADRGETPSNCPTDCSLPALVAPVSEDLGEMFSLFMLIVYILIVVGIAAGGWFAWKKWKNKRDVLEVNSPSDLPPQPPLNQ